MTSSVSDLFGLRPGITRRPPSAKAKGPCLACGRSIHPHESYVRVQGDLLHAECGLYQRRGGR